MAKRHALAILFYLLISIFFLKGVLFSPGIITGADWSLPLTAAQAEAFGNHDLYTWTTIQNAFGARLPHLNTYPFNLSVSFLAKLGVEGALFSKLWLLSLFTLIGFSAYYFCRRLKLSFVASLLSGLVYLTTPIVFNYSSMGWDYVLLAMGIMPFFVLAFLSSIKTEKIHYSVIAGLLFALAACQAQVFFWFPLLMLIAFPFLGRTKKQFFVFIRSFLIIAAIAFACHAVWIIPLVLSPASLVSQSVSTFDLRRFEIRLSLLNMIRLWGSVFNYQFEHTYPAILFPVSFGLPVLASFNLLLKKRDKRVLFLVSIAILPPLLFVMRNFLSSLPFSAVIRDFGRTMVLAAFAYAVLVGIAWSATLKLRSTWKVVGGAAIVVLLLLNAWPFWTGELYGESVKTSDQRVRTLDFPADYQEAEELLLEDETDTKVLYLPGGQVLDFLDNAKFHGNFQETVDLFAQFSQKPGLVAFSGRLGAASVDYGSSILTSVVDDDQAELATLLSLTSVNNIVVRKDVRGSGGDSPDVLRTVEGLSTAAKIFDSPKVAVFGNSKFLPHFYISDSLVYLDGTVVNLADAAEFRMGDWSPRVSIYLGEGESARAEEVLVGGQRKEGLIDTPVRWDRGWAWPEVSVSPESWKYRLVRLKERWVEWKTRNPIDRVDVLLWHGSKRLVEGAPLEDYLHNVGQAVEILKDVFEQERENEGYLGMVEKVLGYMKKGEEDIGDADIKRFNDIFREWVYENFDGWCEEGKYCYEIGVPEDGEYEIYVKEDLREIRDSPLSRTIPNLQLEDASFKATKFQNVAGWTSFGTEAFEEGTHRLRLELPEPENLVREEVLAESLTFYGEIENWQAGRRYEVSFDYQIEDSQEGGGLNFMLFEDEAILLRASLGNTFGEWEQFEKTVRPSFGANTASIWIARNVGGELGDEFRGVEFRNVRVKEILEPEVLLAKKQGKLRDSPLPRTIPNIPKITFVRVNPTKYRVKVEGATDPYTLIFNESFHEGWKVYSKKQGSKETRKQGDYGDIIASYFDGDIKEGTHQNTFLTSSTFETWNLTPLPSDHLIVNGYANSWYIEPTDVDHQESYELIVEFEPQKWMYVGLFVSVLTLGGCLGFIIFSKLKRY